MSNGSRDALFTIREYILVALEEGYAQTFSRHLHATPSL